MESLRPPMSILRRVRSAAPGILLYSLASVLVFTALGVPTHQVSVTAVIPAIAAMILDRIFTMLVSSPSEEELEETRVSMAKTPLSLRAFLWISSAAIVLAVIAALSAALYAVAGLFHTAATALIVAAMLLIGNIAAGIVILLCVAIRNQFRHAQVTLTEIMPVLACMMFYIAAAPSAISHHHSHHSIIRRA